MHNVQKVQNSDYKTPEFVSQLVYRAITWYFGFMTAHQTGDISQRRDLDFLGIRCEIIRNCIGCSFFFLFLEKGLVAARHDAVSVPYKLLRVRHVVKRIPFCSFQCHSLASLAISQYFLFPNFCDILINFPSYIRLSSLNVFVFSIYFFNLLFYSHLFSGYFFNLLFYI